MSVAGLFAGIGGFEYAFSAAGFETNLLAEIDPAARAVLASRFPHVSLTGNVEYLADLDSATTIVTAGFPCQNLSMAGDKTGIRGPKSSVIQELFRLIARRRPTYIVVENVYFMLQLDSGRAMDWLASQFEKLNYQWAYRVVDTMGFGIPQRRRRVYLLASLDQDPRSVLFADNDVNKTPQILDLSRPIGFYWTEGRSGIGLTSDGIPPLKAGSALGIPSPPAVLFPDGEVLIPSVGACEQLQGFRRGWTKVDECLPGRNSEWRLIGNSVSIPVVEWIVARIREPGVPKKYDISEIMPGDRWPRAAWNVGHGRTKVDASETPLRCPTPSIEVFRDETWSRLSERALRGFLGRAEGSNLQLPQGFLDRIRSAKRKDGSESLGGT